MRNRGRGVDKRRRGEEIVRKGKNMGEHGIACERDGKNMATMENRGEQEDQIATTMWQQIGHTGNIKERGGICETNKEKGMHGEKRREQGRQRG